MTPPKPVPTKKELDIVRKLLAYIGEDPDR